MFIPIQATYLPPPVINVLQAVQLGLLAISFTCLFQFGVDLLRPLPGRRVGPRWLPVSALLLWSLAALVWLTIVPVTLAEWCHLAGIWSRYLLGFPGAVLAAYALYRFFVERISHTQNSSGSPTPPLQGAPGSGAKGPFW